MVPLRNMGHAMRGNEYSRRNHQICPEGTTGDGGCKHPGHWNVYEVEMFGRDEGFITLSEAQA